MRKVEREPVRTRRAEPLQPAVSFFHGGDVPRRYPPQRLARDLGFLEPASTVLIHRRMRGTVGEGLQRFHALPNRHVHQQVRVVGNPDRRGVAGAVLQSPHEAPALIGHFVDRGNLGVELRHQFAARRPERFRDVNLRQMPIVHSLPFLSSGCGEASPRPRCDSSPRIPGTRPWTVGPHARGRTPATVSGSADTRAAGPPAAAQSRRPR